MPCAMWTAIGAMHVHDERASGRFRGWPARSAGGWFPVQFGGSSCLPATVRRCSCVIAGPTSRVHFERVASHIGRHCRSGQEKFCGSAWLPRCQDSVRFLLSPAPAGGEFRSAEQAPRGTLPPIFAPPSVVLPSGLWPSAGSAPAESQSRCTVASPRLAARNAASGFHVHCRPAPARPVRPYVAATRVGGRRAIERCKTKGDWTR